MYRLLENFAISPVVLLAVDIDRLVPRPLVLEELLVFSLAGVELDELVAFPVRSDVKSGQRNGTILNLKSANEKKSGSMVRLLNS